MQKNKVVVDTSVLISAFVFGGKPKLAIRKIFKYSEIYVSPELLTEYKEAPRGLIKEDKISFYQFEVLIEGIATFVSQAMLVYPGRKLTICRDSEDNMLLECCLEVKADFLITGDKDLLEIDIVDLPQELHNLKIISPSQL